MVKDNEMRTFHYISEFENIYKEDEQNERIKPIRGTRFPTNPYTALENAQKPLLFQYGWTARDKHFNDYIIPNNFDFANWEILVHNEYYADQSPQRL